VTATGLPLGQVGVIAEVVGVEQLQVFLAVCADPEGGGTRQPWRNGAPGRSSHSRYGYIGSGRAHQAGASATVGGVRQLPRARSGCSDPGPRQGGGRKRGGTARPGRSPTDDPARSARTFPQVAAHLAQRGPTRLNVGLACKQGVGGSSPPAGSTLIAWQHDSSVKHTRCTSPENRSPFATPDGLTWANAVRRASVRTSRMSASVREMQGPIARGSHASPTSYARLHTRSLKRARTRQPGPHRRTLQAQLGDFCEVAAGQDWPVRTDGLAASVAASALAG
jgi:hypothetical protein